MFVVTVVDVEGGCCNYWRWRRCAVPVLEVCCNCTGAEMCVVTVVEVEVCCNSRRYMRCVVTVLERDELFCNCTGGG